MWKYDPVNIVKVIGNTVDLLRRGLAGKIEICLQEALFPSFSAFLKNEDI